MLRAVSKLTVPKACPNITSDNSLRRMPKINVPVIPSGSIALDKALGVGGLPRGRVIEIFGPESSGKTTLALHAVANTQKQGGIAAFIDAEHALDTHYAKKLGVNCDELLVAQPDTGEQALEITDMLVRSGAIDIVVIDSVAALVPRAEEATESALSDLQPQFPPTPAMAGRSSWSPAERPGRTRCAPGSRRFESATSSGCASATRSERYSARSMSIRLIQPWAMDEPRIFPKSMLGSRMSSV